MSEEQGEMTTVKEREHIQRDRHIRIDALSILTYILIYYLCFQTAAGCRR